MVTAVLGSKYTSAYEKSKVASTKFWHGFIFLDRKLRQILRRMVFSYIFKNLILSLEVSVI